jgi:hypothetical protein
MYKELVVSSIFVCVIASACSSSSSSDAQVDASTPGNDAASDSGANGIRDAGSPAPDASADAAPANTGMDAAQTDASPFADAAASDALPGDAIPTDAASGDAAVGDASAGGQQFGQPCDAARTCASNLMCFMFFNASTRGFCTQPCDSLTMPCPASPTGAACDLANATATGSLCGWPCTGPGDTSCPQGLTCQNVGGANFCSS